MRLRTKSTESYQSLDLCVVCSAALRMVVSWFVGSRLKYVDNYNMDDCEILCSYLGFQKDEKASLFFGMGLNFLSFHIMNKGTNHVELHRYLWNNNMKAP